MVICTRTLLCIILFERSLHNIEAQDLTSPSLPQQQRPVSLVFGDEELPTISTRPSLFGLTIPTKPPPIPKVPDGNLSCYSCRLDFRKGYDSKNHCLGRHRESLNPEYIVNCGRKDIFCRVERTETNGMLILLTRECVDSCYYGCRPKGFGINSETCAECCNTFACNNFYPKSGTFSVNEEKTLFLIMACLVVSSEGHRL